jgi:hypothetical protein
MSKAPVGSSGSGRWVEVDRLSLRDLSAGTWAAPGANALGGMVYEELFRRFGANATQLDLLDDRRTV